MATLMAASWTRSWRRCSPSSVPSGVIRPDAELQQAAQEARHRIRDAHRRSVRKRTITMFGENDDPGWGEVSRGAGSHPRTVQGPRPSTDPVSTSTAGDHGRALAGEPGRAAGLVDALCTSDDYLLAQASHQGGRHPLQQNQGARPRSLASRRHWLEAGLAGCGSRSPEC